MKVIKSTGNAEEDAKLVAEALGSSNTDTFDEAKEKMQKSFRGKDSGNTLVSQPLKEGETLLVLPDAKPATTEFAKKEEPKGLVGREKNFFDVEYK